MPSKQKQLSFRLSDEEYKKFQAFLLLKGEFKFNNAAAKFLFLEGLEKHVEVATHKTDLGTITLHCGK